MKSLLNNKSRKEKILYYTVGMILLAVFFYYAGLAIGEAIYYLSH